MVLIAALFEIVTDVGAPLLAKVAVSSGTVGLELQLVPVVHSEPGPCQVPSTANAVTGASRASAPSQALPNSAARIVAGRILDAATSMAISAFGPPGACRHHACGAGDRNSCERIPPNPCT